MSNRFRRFDWLAVSKGKSKLLNGQAIWLIRSAGGEIRLNIEFPDSRDGVLIDSDRSLIVASSDWVKIESENGLWRFQKIPLFEAAKLLAFLETSTGTKSSLPRSTGNVVTYASSDLNIWKFEGWLIEHVANHDLHAGGVLDFLRAQESYGLVRFLLEEGESARTVGSLGEQYGVSASHFRRLCRRALGNGLKRELRMWRAARAVLRIVESGDSMTEVAMSNGFSSSSHFSREIKDLFGISPCQFRAGHKELR
ncbi:AraC family transcriptional regulator [Burkholderia ubonensis]|uniref:helix-turn-helix domain-containing protein n=1 Tax=Burkholderia ubonensis TaxID=101571 RepID=UPI000753131F|nr:helix-turn-helix domain-containing protein [Burkholderia ubonensis]KVM73936.1 AraC family transcriptional regulator [Burkholderia ubonensis]